MRVLTVIPGDGHGVAYIWARRQAVSLERAGVEVRQFFLASRTSPVRLASELHRYREELAAFDPDVVHAHYGAVAGFFSSYGTSRPVVLTLHGSDINPCPSISQIRLGIGHALSQLAARKAKRIICVSDELLGRLRWGRERAAVIPVGVDIRRFAPRLREESRNQLGWTHDDPVVLFSAGADYKVKRLDLAEAAFEAALARRPGLRLDIMRGDIQPDDVPLHMAAADVLLFTSDFEGSPMVIKEAIACGLPIVTVEVGDVRRRLAGVEPSRIVARDPATLGMALVELVMNGRRSNGPAVAARDFSEERVAEQVVEICRQAAG